MIKIIKFQGGLGNQMFQYAFYLALKSEHPFSVYLFDIERSIHAHNGFELPFIFNNYHRGKSFLYSFFRKHLSGIIRNSHYITQIDSLRYEPELLKTAGRSIIYSGFWQTEKYFINIEKQVRKAFIFNESIVNDKNKKLSQEIQSKESVSIHIRRGDYLSEASIRATCDLIYYKNAIDYILLKIKSPEFFVFSDDISWCRKELSIENATFIGWNKGKDSWQDMYLMSRCKHNIVANSTFSWWGAWLNDNPNKIVIAPKIWFYGNYNEDIIPKKWIRL